MRKKGGLPTIARQVTAWSNSRPSADSSTAKALFQRNPGFELEMLNKQGCFFNNHGFSSRVERPIVANWDGHQTANTNR